MDDEYGGGGEECGHVGREEFRLSPHGSGSPDDGGAEDGGSLSLPRSPTLAALVPGELTMRLTQATSGTAASQAAGGHYVQATPEMAFPSLHDDEEDDEDVSLEPATAAVAAMNEQLASGWTAVEPAQHAPIVPLSQQYPTLAEDFLAPSRPHAFRQADHIAHTRATRVANIQAQVLQPQQQLQQQQQRPPPPAKRPYEPMEQASAPKRPRTGVATHAPPQQIPQPVRAPQPPVVLRGPAPSAIIAAPHSAASSTPLDPTDAMSRFLEDDLDMGPDIDSDAFDKLFAGAQQPQPQFQQPPPPQQQAPPHIAPHPATTSGPVLSSSLSIAPRSSALVLPMRPAALLRNLGQPSLPRLPLPPPAPLLSPPQPPPQPMGPPSPRPPPPQQQQQPQLSTRSPQAAPSFQQQQRAPASPLVMAAPPISPSPAAPTTPIGSPIAPSTTPHRVAQQVAAPPSYYPSPVQLLPSNRPSILESPMPPSSSAPSGSMLATPNSLRTPTPAPKLEYPGAPSPFGRRATPLVHAFSTYTVRLTDGSAPVERHFPGPIGRLRKKVKAEEGRGMQTPTPAAARAQAVDLTREHGSGSGSDQSQPTPVGGGPSLSQESLEDAHDAALLGLHDPDFHLAAWQAMLHALGLNMPSEEEACRESAHVYVATAAEPRPALDDMDPPSPWRLNLRFLSAPGVRHRAPLPTLRCMVVSAAACGQDVRVRLKDPFGCMEATVSHDATARHPDLLAPHSVLELTRVPVFHASPQPAHRVLIVTAKNVVRVWRQAEEHHLAAMQAAEHHQHEFDQQQQQQQQQAGMELTDGAPPHQQF